MNHSVLKKFAPQARRDLIQQVGARLEYVLRGDSVELREREAQVKQLREVLTTESKEALVDRVAYTWFNRLAALRFMDARDYHPFGGRVITAAPGQTQPEILRQARNGIFPDDLKVDRKRVNELLDEKVPSSNPQAEVYRLLVVAVCNYYHDLMPFVFEKVADYTELLLPEDLLSETSIAQGFRTAISDDDCRDVEILGWLYQYYIAEKKNEVMGRKKAVPKEDIPAVTQLFTPHWIVRYMVENSLGRLWMQSRPESRLIERMDYYIPDPQGGQVESGECEVGSNYESKELSRTRRVAEGDPAGGEGVSSDPGVSNRGNLRADEPTASSGRVDPLEHSGGSGKDQHSGIQELPLDFDGIKGGSGDTNRDRSETELSERGSSNRDPQPERGNQEDDSRPHRQTPLSSTSPSTKSSHSPLPTPHWRISSPEEIRLIDPACGSGHILTYAFDLLYAIYEEEGYEPSAIPGHILTKNLYGVEIDERAAGLAYFALVMKAQQYSKRFLRKLRRSAETPPPHSPLHTSHSPLPTTSPNILCLQEIHFEEGELKAYMDALDLGELFTEPVLRLMHQFKDAKNLGSLIQPMLDDVGFLRDAVEQKDLGGDLFLFETHRKVLTVIRQAEFLAQRYHCAVVNPPYMNKFNGPLKSFVEEHFKDYKSDLFAAFIIRAKAMTLDGGLLGFMTPFVWMFISSYEKLRNHLLNDATITSLIQLEYSGFDGATVPICTFTLLNKHLPDYKGGFVRLTDFRGAKNQGPKALEIIDAARKIGK